MLYNIKIIFSLQHITTSPIKTKTPTKTLEVTLPAFCPVLWRNENHCVGTIFYLICFCMELNSFKNRCKVWVDHYRTVVFSILFYFKVWLLLALMISLLSAQQNAFLLIVENRNLLKTSCCSENLRVKGRCSCNSCKTAVVSQRKPLF